MNENDFKSVLNKDYKLFISNYEELNNICNQIIEISKSKTSIASYLCNETFIPKQIEIKISVIENIKSNIDINNKYEKPQLMLNVRDYIIQIISITRDLREAIFSKNDLLINKYSKLLIEKLAINI